MNVEKVRFKLNNTAPAQQNRLQPPNFTARYTTPAKAVDIVMADEVKEFIPSAVKGMKKLSDNMGEVQNIIINALGTGLVAPIFIKWNPLSKTDEDTRTYSAWRQPVSAVLTVLTQVGITIPFNRMIDRRANKGFYDEQYNKTLFQDKNYIAKIMKNQYPYATKNVIDMMVDDKMTEQRNTLLRMIREDKIVMRTDNGEALPMNNDSYRQLKTNVIEKQLKYEKGELKKCNEITIPKKIKRGEYYRTHKDEALKIFTEINQKLEATTNPNSVKKYVKQLKSKHKNGDKELLAIFQDIIDRRGNTSEDTKIAMKDKMKGILADIETYTKFDSAEALSDYVKDLETRIRINPIEEAIDGLEGALKRINNKETAGQVENYFKSLVHNNPNHRLSKFEYGKEIANAFENIVKKNIKAHKQITGLIVSFLMLPVTCSLLNWCYPRFMDAVFPNLSNKKHPNEVKDLVNKANGQTEVKS